jgi:hypothetical protein
MNDPPFTFFGGVCLVGAVSAAYSPISAPGPVRFTRKKGVQTVMRNTLGSSD